MPGERRAEVIDIVPELRRRARAGGPDRGRRLSRILVLPPHRVRGGDDPRPPAA